MPDAAATTSRQKSVSAAMHPRIGAVNRLPLVSIIG